MEPFAVMNCRLCIIIVFLCSSCLSFCFSDEGATSLDNWFASNFNSTTYNSVKSELLILFSEAYKQHIPLVLLTELMDEGAAKGVIGERVVLAVKQKIMDLQKIQAFFNSDTNCFREIAPGGPDNPEYLRSWMLFRKRGLDETVLQSLLIFSCNQKLEKQRLFAVFRGLSGIPGLSQIPNDILLQLGTALLESNLAAETFDSMGSFYLKGRLRNIMILEITQIIIDALKSGKGLVRIEQELERRGHK